MNSYGWLTHDNKEARRRQAELSGKGARHYSRDIITKPNGERSRATRRMLREVINPLLRPSMGAKKASSARTKSNDYHGNAVIERACLRSDPSPERPVLTGLDGAPGILSSVPLIQASLR